MGFGAFVLTVGALAATLVTGAETRTYEQWVGVWQGELDGQPGVTVTLGQDSGSLEGTIVFNVVMKEEGEAHVAGHDAHVMIRVRVEQNALAFQVIRSSDARELHLTMRLTGYGRAQLECGDCGGPPSTELLRIK